MAERQVGVLVYISLLALISFGAGIAGLLFPHTIQAYSLRLYESGRSSKNPLLRFNPFLGFMKTPSYILSLRLCGIIALGISLLFFYALFHRLFG